MKLTNLLSVAVATMVGATSLTAMDGEFAVLNPTQAKLRGSYYKARAAAAHHAHINATDTDALLQTIGGDTQAYINAIKADVIGAFNAWFNPLIPAGDGNAVLHAGSFAGAGNGVANVNIESFRAGFAAVVNGFTHAALAAHHADVPVDGSMHELSASQQSVNIAMGAVIDAWIDLVVPGGANTQLLAAAANGQLGAAGLGNNEKGTFKAALLGVISRG